LSYEGTSMIQDKLYH